MIIMDPHILRRSLRIIVKLRYLLAMTPRNPEEVEEAVVAVTVVVVVVVAVTKKVVVLAAAVVAAATVAVGDNLS